MPAAAATSSSTSCANAIVGASRFILDVVYNHYTFDAERAEWAYDSNTPENNIYYWYEGRTSDYPNAHPPDGGYIDNGSSG